MPDCAIASFSFTRKYNPIRTPCAERLTGFHSMGYTLCGKNYAGGSRLCGIFVPTGLSEKCETEL